MPRAQQVLDAEADGGEGILDLVRHLARHLAPREHARRARERGRVVERDDAAVGTRAERRELNPDLAAADLEFALRDPVAARREELAHRFPHRAPLEPGHLLPAAAPPDWQE